MYYDYNESSWLAQRDARSGRAGLKGGAMSKAKAFGAEFKRRRIEMGLSLREFCRRTGLDPGNVSKLERGKLAPPTEQKTLAEYAEFLGIAEGSPDRETFFDLAAACAGRIPGDILSDEELVRKLPLVFRTCRGAKLTDGQLDSLADKIRRA